MAKERWQPPPMKPPTPATDAAPKVSKEPKLTVDENVVRKMLKVNPAMRQGRTTFQVKKALESGAPIMSATPAEAPLRTAPQGTAGELRDTVAFFLRSKLEALSAREADIEARRKALDDELAAARNTLRDQVSSFLSLLDQSALATHGPAALAEHAAALKRIGLDPAQVLDTIRRKT